MKLDVISYHDLLDSKNIAACKNLEIALLNKGIVGIKDVPEFETITRAYVNAARKFSVLCEDIKKQYAPDRDAGKTEGYELGAEWFKTPDGVWQIDDKKASFYANVPEHPRNIWPSEVDLKIPYLKLGELIFNTGKLLLNALGLNEAYGLNQVDLVGYGRMLHYHKENDATNVNMNWCGAHFDHGVFTGLIPAYYFRDGVEIEEPEEAGLYIARDVDCEFEKIDVSDKSILLFQVGEFGQLISNDRIRATCHMVKKSCGGVERYSFALFHSAAEHVVIQSKSRLTEDARYKQNQLSDGSISYGKWEAASYERYRAK